jgi:hypothetical protein
MFRKDLLKAWQLNTFHKIIPNVKSKQAINSIGAMGIVGQAASTCGAFVPHSPTIALTEKEWQTVEQEVLIQLCFTDYKNTAMTLQMNKGNKEYDLTSTDVMAIIQECTYEAILKAYIRIAYMSDKDACHTDDSPYGVINPAYDIKFFNLLDGFYKQLYDICAADPTRRITIAANAEANYAAQYDEIYNLTPAIAWGILRDLTLKAKFATRGKAGYAIKATQTLYDRAAQYISDKSIPNTYVNMVDGVAESMKVQGTMVYADPLMEEMICDYEQDGTKYNNPHRAVYFHKDNLPIAVPGTQLLTELDVIPDPITQYINIRAKGELDVKVIDDDLIMFAY